MVISVPCATEGCPNWIDKGPSDANVCLSCALKTMAVALAALDQAGELERDPAQFAEERLAGTYLSTAAQHFCDACDREKLFTKCEDPVEAPGQLQADYLFGAPQKRLASCRNGTLYSALAAEAYVNQFLAAMDSEKFDKLEAEKATVIPRKGDSRPDKYVDGVERVTGEPSPFDLGKNPLQTMAGLFKLRNRLAHPKVKTVKLSGTGVFIEPGFDDFNPRDVAKGLVAVATAARTLSGIDSKALPLDDTARFIVENENKVTAMGQAGMQLPPHFVSDTPPPNLLLFPITRLGHWHPITSGSMTVTSSIGPDGASQTTIHLDI
jgi:hypothetical protein